MEQSENKYDIEWFKRRALESIHRISSKTWDYSDSLLLYISSGVEKYESLQEEDTPYFNLVTKPEREYLQSIAKDVVGLLPSNFEYIDLGPGTEHKEQFFFDELERQGKKFTYIPVDISDYYLKLSEKHASDQGIPVRTLQAPFEEVAQILGERTVPRFVNIGLTFSNYNPQTILSLMKDVAGSDGFVFINSQMRDRVNMVELQKVYAEDGVTLADDKLKLIGLDPHRDVSPRETTDEIRVWGTVLNLSKEAQDIGIGIGDKMLVFQSLRYIATELENEVKTGTKGYHLFDTGKSFIAGLIYT
jgi:hypothetical protein